MNSISKEINALQHEGKKLIVFDGICSLCHKTVQWVIRKDTHNVFKFVSAQSEKGKLVLAHMGIPVGYTDSIILIHPNKAYYLKSEAAMEIATELGKEMYIMAILFKILPIGFRDRLYDLIAKNRYQWFGKLAGTKNESCSLPLNKDATNTQKEDSVFL